MRGDSNESCTNCGSAVTRRYCADCGQAVPRATDYSLRAFAADSIDQIASVDGRAVRTVKTLLARPVDRAAYTTAFDGRVESQRSVAVSAALAVAFAGLLLAYRGLLFFTTYYTL